jgi:hypothetical protein
MEVGVWCAVSAIRKIKPIIFSDNELRKIRMDTFLYQILKLQAMKRSNAGLTGKMLQLPTTPKY